MQSWPILSVVTFLPLAGVLFILTVKGDDAVALRNIRWGALWTTAVTFLVSLLIWVNFNPAEAGFQFVVHRRGHAAWLEQMGGNRCVHGVSLRTKR